MISLMRDMLSKVEKTLLIQKVKAKIVVAVHFEERLLERFEGELSDPSGDIARLTKTIEKAFQKAYPRRKDSLYSSSL